MLSAALPAPSHDMRRVQVLDKPAANATVDWRTSGAVTPVKNQEHCGVRPHSPCHSPVDQRGRLQVGEV